MSYLILKNSPHIFKENGESFCGSSTAPINFLEKNDGSGIIKCSLCQKKFQEKKRGEKIQKIPQKRIKKTSVQLDFIKELEEEIWTEVHPSINYIAIDSDGAYGYIHKPNFFQSEGRNCWYDQRSSWVFPLKELPRGYLSSLPFQKAIIKRPKEKKHWWV